MREFSNDRTAHEESSERVRASAESGRVYIASFGAAFSILRKKNVPQYATFMVAAYVWTVSYIGSLSMTEISMW